jgi:hypothetical protein
LKPTKCRVLDEAGQHVIDGNFHFDKSEGWFYPDVTGPQDLKLARATLESRDGRRFAITDLHRWHAGNVVQYEFKIAHEMMP